MTREDVEHLERIARAARHELEFPRPPDHVSVLAVDLRMLLDRIDGTAVAEVLPSGTMSRLCELVKRPYLRGVRR